MGLSVRSANLLGVKASWRRWHCLAGILATCAFWVLLVGTIAMFRQVSRNADVLGVLERIPPAGHPVHYVEEVGE